MEGLRLSETHASHMELKCMVQPFWMVYIIREGEEELIGRGLHYHEGIIPRTYKVCDGVLVHKAEFANEKVWFR